MLAPSARSVFHNLCITSVLFRVLPSRMYFWLSFVNKQEIGMKVAHITHIMIHLAA